MEDDLFLSQQHPYSRRWAIIEDDGTTGWLYLTAPDSTKPVAHCWLYNRIKAPAGRIFGRGDTPIVPADFLVDSAPFPAPPATSVHFRWTHDGQGVAVLLDKVLVGYIAKPGGSGYSKNLKSSGPYGSPLDYSAYTQVFGEG